MKPQFLTFRRFNEPALANRLTDVLDANGIKYEIEENSLVANPLLVSGDELATEYVIKLQQQDFDKMNDLLLADEVEAVNDVEKDYYLFEFTDQELVDIIKNFDEWSAFDFALARKVLKDRGVVINDQHIADFRQDKLDMLKQPERSQTTWIVIGYMASLLGGILGIFIGWMMWKFKKTLPNGDSVYAYTESDRKHGKRIFIISVIVATLSVIARFYNDYNRY